MSKMQPYPTRLLLHEADQWFADYDRTSDRTIHMQYENHVADHGLIHRMLDFLGLEWTATAVEAVMATSSSASSSWLRNKVLLPVPAMPVRKTFSPDSMARRRRIAGSVLMR